MRTKLKGCHLQFSCHCLRRLLSSPTPTAFNDRLPWCHLQGRMYVFDHYVCFYSAVFGFAKKRRIPMRVSLV